MNIQWYPGHMTKARRAMEESIRLIDVIIELVDARLPVSSRNPDIDRLGQNKFRLILLNKADLADEEGNRQWEDWFSRQGVKTIRLDARTSNRMKEIQQAIQQVCKEKIERDRQRGIRNRPVRAMVAGIPNVGKSTFINSFTRKAITRTGNKPGVTRGNQWIRLNQNVELLDTPGILWPKFDDPAVGVRLALAGSINDEILNLTELSLEGLRYLAERYPEAVPARYEGISLSEDPYETLQEIAKLRHALKKGGEPDTEKAASLFLDDLRSGRLGRVTFEWPED